MGEFCGDRQGGLNMGRLLRRLLWLGILLGGVFLYQLATGSLDKPPASWKTRQYIDTVDPLTVKYADCQTQLDRLITKSNWTRRDEQLLSENLDCMIDVARSISRIEPPTEDEIFPKFHDIVSDLYDVLLDVRKDFWDCYTYAYSSSCEDLNYDLGRWDGLNNELARELAQFEKRQ
jgi:hypothetical protein